ncbi:hypothetical protein OH492_12870 [Vibrio chagasii]|nr:hypothetical protein [Vibrio chagasii]
MEQKRHGTVTCLQDQIVITGGGDGEGFLLRPDMERMVKKVRGALMEL